MPTLIDHYRELLSLTQIYLLRNCSSETVTATPALFSYFNKKEAPQSPLPQAVKSQFSQKEFIKEKQEEKKVPVISEGPPSLPDKSAIKVVPPPVEKKEEVQSTPVVISQKQKGSLSLEPFTPTRHDLNEFWKLHRDLFPDTPLYETIPDDAVALKIKNGWKEEQTIPPVVILSFNDKENEIAFLKNVAKAISIRFITARVISVAKWEKEQGLEALLNCSHLKLVIAPDHEFYMHQELMKHYRSDNHGRHTLKNSPLLLLSDPSLYLKEPQLKSLLWRAFCNDFASSN